MCPKLKAVVEAGEAGTLKGGHPQNVLEEDSTAGRRKASQAVPCIGAIIHFSISMWPPFCIHVSDIQH